MSKQPIPRQKLEQLIVHLVSNTPVDPSIRQRYNQALEEYFETKHEPPPMLTLLNQGFHTKEKVR